MAYVTDVCSERVSRCYSRIIPLLFAVMRNTWTERLVQDGNKAAGQTERHDIIVEQGNKELLPAIVLPFCSGLGSVSRGFLWHTDHTHKHTLVLVKPNLGAEMSLQ